MGRIRLLLRLLSLSRAVAAISRVAEVLLGAAKAPR